MKNGYMKPGNGKDQSLSPGGEFIKKVGITKKVDSTIQTGAQDLVPQVVSPHCHPETMTKALCLGVSR